MTRALAFMAERDHAQFAAAFPAVDFQQPIPSLAVYDRLRDADAINPAHSHIAIVTAHYPDSDIFRRIAEWAAPHDRGVLILGSKPEQVDAARSALASVPRTVAICSSRPTLDELQAAINTLAPGAVAQLHPTINLATTSEAYVSHRAPVFAVTSARGRVGKSTIAANLAIKIAHHAAEDPSTALRVVVVELDHDNPKLSGQYTWAETTVPTMADWVQLDQNPATISDYLTTPVCTIDKEWVIPTGSVRFLLAPRKEKLRQLETITGPAATNIIEALRTNPDVDVVIVETGPVARDTDPDHPHFSALRAADRRLFITDAMSDSYSVVAEGLQRLITATGSDPVTWDVVINDVIDPDPTSPTRELQDVLDAFEAAILDYTGDRGEAERFRKRVLTLVPQHSYLKASAQTLAKDLWLRQWVKDPEPAEHYFAEAFDSLAAALIPDLHAGPCTNPPPPIKRRKWVRR